MRRGLECLEEGRPSQKKRGFVKTTARAACAPQHLGFLQNARGKIDIQFKVGGVPSSKKTQKREFNCPDFVRVLRSAPDIEGPRCAT
jgi:hypothetical protein